MITCAMCKRKVASNKTIPVRTRQGTVNYCKQGCLDRHLAADHLKRSMCVDMFGTSDFGVNRYGEN